MQPTPAGFGRKHVPPPSLVEVVDNYAAQNSSEPEPSAADHFRAQLAAEAAGRRRNDDIEYEIKGAELQFVEIALDPGESAIAEAGAMVWKDVCVDMITGFGNGDGPDSGVLGKLLGAGRRIVTGENLFVTVFTNTGAGKARVAFAAPAPGNILPFNLADYGGMLVCQKDSFLAAAKGVSILPAPFGDEGFPMQKLEGDGWVFVQMGGAVIERELAQGEHLHVGTGCVAAFEPSVDFNRIGSGGIKSRLLSDDGPALARLSGPGKIWLQSLPLARLAGRMSAASGMPGPLVDERDRDEGSLLMDMGDLVLRNL